MLVAPTAAYQTDDFAAAADRLGVDLALGTDRCHVLAEVWPEGALALDFRDPPGAAGAIAADAAARPLHGIAAVDERSALIASLAADRLGLRCSAPAAVATAGNKLAFRRALAAAGVPQPEFQALPAVAGAAEITLAPPLVVKPVHLSASRGVIGVAEPAALPAALARVRALLADPEVTVKDPDAAGWLLVERFVAGPEVAFEGLLERGRLHALALFDKPDPLDGPLFPDTIYVAPSAAPAALQAEVAGVVAAAAAANGLAEGPVHAELRLGEHGPVMLELAARAIGGLCGRTLRFGAGITLEEVILCHALGRAPASLRRRDGASGVCMLPVPAAGVLRDIDGTGAAAAVPGVVDIAITARIGDVLVPLPEGHTYMGFLFARGDRPEEVVAALRRARDHIRFEVTPLL
jgi:biotin carboxylase